MYKAPLVILALCLIAASAFAVEESAAVRAPVYGSDISMLPRFEELGAVYRDKGEPADATGKKFPEDVIRAVRSTPHGLGKGVLWWYSESIPVKGLEVWKGGSAALFDVEGNALPAMDAFQK